MPERDDGPSDERPRDLQQQVDRLLDDRTRLRVDLQGTERELEEVRHLNERLMADRAELEAQLGQVSSERTQLPIAAVGEQLRAALVDLGRTPAPEDARVDYVARSVRFEVKANLGFDAEGAAVLRFPTIGEQVQPHELASIHLEFDAAPRPDVDLSSLVPVPQVVGASEDVARSRLTGSGLAVGQRSEREALVAPGTVLEQDPPRGAYADPGTPVDLVVAIPTRVDVPDVVGRQSAEAVTMLRTAGFEVPPTATTERDDRPEGEVVVQDPAAGQRVAFGATVTLTVATAPPRVTVPKLRGSSLTDALASIEEAGLVSGQVGRLRSDQAAGTVLRQDPAAGTAVPPGTSVDLVVAETGIERSVAVPDVMGQRRDDAVDVLTDDGWGVRLLRAADPDADSARTRGVYGVVVGQEPPAGQPVPVSNKLVTLHVVASPEPVERVQGIGRAAAQRLAEDGVRTVGELALLPAGELAELLDVGLERARELHEAAQHRDDAYGLEGVEGIDRGLADLLAHAGVRDQGALAAADPAALARRLRRVAEEHPPPEDLRLTPAALRPVIAAVARSPGRS